MRYQIFIGESATAMQYAATATDLRRAQVLARQILDQRYSSSTQEIIHPFAEIRVHPDDLKPGATQIPSWPVPVCCLIGDGK